MLGLVEPVVAAHSAKRSSQSHVSLLCRSNYYYPNVFNVQSSLMNIQELLQIKHITTGLTARTLSFFFLEKEAPDVIFPVLQRLTHIKIKLDVTGMLIFA